MYLEVFEICSADGDEFHVSTGQWLIEKARPDIVKKFTTFLSDDVNVIPQYIYQCNSQKPRLAYSDR